MPPRQLCFEASEITNNLWCFFLLGDFEALSLCGILLVENKYKYEVFYAIQNFFLFSVCCARTSPR